MGGKLTFVLNLNLRLTGDLLSATSTSSGIYFQRDLVPACSAVGFAQNVTRDLLPPRYTFSDDVHTVQILRTPPPKLIDHLPSSSSTSQAHQPHLPSSLTPPPKHLPSSSTSARKLIDPNSQAHRPPLPSSSTPPPNIIDSLPNLIGSTSQAYRPHPSSPSTPPPKLINSTS